MMKKGATEGVLTSNVKFPILPPVGHMGGEPDASTVETCGGAGSVAEGRDGVKALGALKVKLGNAVRVLFSDATLEAVELELSHATSEVTKLPEVRDANKTCGGHFDLLLLTSNGPSVGNSDSSHGSEREVDRVCCRVFRDDISPRTSLQSHCKMRRTRKRAVCVV